MESNIEENQELILSFNSARISFAEEEEADIVISPHRHHRAQESRE